MSYPAGWDLVNVTGTYIARDGVPCSGSVTFSSPQMVLRSGTIVPAADIVFTLDATGKFSGQIPATDDPNATPSGWLYTVTENVPGGRSGFLISAPHTSPGIDLSTVVPVVFPVPPATQYPLVTLQQLAGTNPGQGIQLVGFPAGSNPNQAPTNQFFAQNGAGIWRVNDRLFVAGATASSGDFPQTTNDWFSAFEKSVGYASPTAPGMLFVLTNNAKDSASAIAGAAQSLDFVAAGTAGIGIQSYVVNNNATLPTYMWAYYGEAHLVSAAAGPVYGMELDTRTLFAGSKPDPFNQGSVVGLQLASGAGLTATGQFDASCAIEIEDNPLKFHTGIVFGKNSITGADGTGGSMQGTAIALGPGHGIEWYGSAGTVVARIASNATALTNATGIAFGTNGLQIYSIQANSPSIAYFSATAAAVNYLSFSAASTGQAPYIGAFGTDTNVDLRLLAQGTGAVWLGPFTATPPTATGYITVKDSTGTVRKLLCA